MARRQRHVFDFGGVPCGHDHSTGIGIVANQIHDIRNLVNRAVGVVLRGRRPAAPLHAVDRPQVAVGIRPLIPDVHAMLDQPIDVAAALEEPQQFVSHALEPHPFRGDEREAFAKVEAHLLTEQADGARASAVGFKCAFGEDATHKVFVRRRDVAFRLGGNASANGFKFFWCQSHGCQSKREDLKSELSVSRQRNRCRDSPRTSARHACHAERLRPRRQALHPTAYSHASQRPVLCTRRRRIRRYADRCP